MASSYQHQRIARNRPGGWIGLLLVLGSLWLAIPAAAQTTDHTGTCTGTFAAADNPHRLTGFCTVPAGETLVLEAGVTLDGQGRTLRVEGTLTANGVTLTDVFLEYHDGSGGTLQNSAVSGSTGAFFTGSSVTNAAAPTLRGNTLTVTSVGFDVRGTARPSLRNNTVTTNGVGLRYFDSAAGSASGNTINFTPEGSNGRRGIEVNAAASPTLDSNTIADDSLRSDIGIALQVNAASTVTVTGNTIRATGDDRSFTLSPDFFSAATTVTDNVVEGSGGAGFGLLGGTITADAVLQAVDGRTSFDLTSTWTVDSGVTLTILPGITVEGGIFRINGTLNADTVTLTNALVDYRDGSDGTLQNSTLSGSTPLFLTGNSVANPAAPTLSGNTITSTFIGIDVQGTAQPVITDNTMTTNTIGLRYFNSAAGSASGNTINFTPEGSNGRHGIQVNGEASPAIDGNTITDDVTRADVGIALQVVSGSAVTVTGNTICSTENDRPFIFTLGFFGTTGASTVADNTLECGVGSGFGLSGTADTNVTLVGVDGQTVFALISTLTIDSGVTVTIPAGLTLEGSNNAFRISGRLNADGATFNNMFLDYRDGSAGTVQNSTINGFSPIFLSSSSVANPAAPTLHSNTIISTTLGIDVRGTAQPVITDNTMTTNNAGLRYSDTAAGSATGNTINFTPEGSNGRRGIEVNNMASPTLTNNSITDDTTRADIGISLQVLPGSAVTVTDNSICSTGDDQPFIFSPGFFGAAVTVANNDLVCGTGNGLGLSGTVSADTALQAVAGQTTFRLIGFLSVDAGVTLTVPPGVTLDGQNNALRVNGLLQVDGATFSNVFLDYRDGSGGIIRNSTLNGSTPISVFSSTLATVATPSFDNNILNASFTGFNISGTAQPSITNNTITTNNFGIRYSETAAGTAAGNTIDFVLGANNGRRGIELNAGASPVIDSNTIMDDASRSDIGIALQVNASSTATIINNAICATGSDQPFSFTPEFFATALAAMIADNDLICGTGLGFGLSGTAQTDVTLVSIGEQGAFTLVSTLAVNAGATLTIPQGITLNGQFNTLLVDGALNLNRATVRDTRLEYRNGSTGSVRNTMFTSTFLFQSISIASATVSLQGNRFEGLPTVLSLSGTAAVQATSNTFRLNQNVIEIQSPDVNLTLTDNEFDRNQRTLIYSNANALFSAFPADFESNAFLGTIEQNTIQLPSTIDVEGTLQATPVPYTHFGMTISPTVTLRLMPGVILQAQNFVAITAEGELIARGTRTRPVIFTTVNPKSGLRWGGLTIRNKQQDTNVSILENCVVEFGGNFFGGANVTLDNASTPIRNCTISDGASVGIHLLNNAAPIIENNAILQNASHGIQSASGANPLIQNNSILSNGGNGIQNDDATIEINAENNFWGDDDGPQNAANDTRCNTLANPAGGGEEVSDCVDFDPWIRLGPSLEGAINIISGNNQSGTAGETLAAPLVVAVVSTLGSPLEGIEVIFTIIQGDAGIVEEMPVVTTANGRARATVQLGLTPGDVQIAVTARDINSPLATFAGSSAAPLRFALNATGGCPRDGDVNGDGRVTPADALRVFEHAMGDTGETLDACAQAHADVYRPLAGLTRELTPQDALCIFLRFFGGDSCTDSAATIIVGNDR